jgi:hypothetical protein
MSMDEIDAKHAFAIDRRRKRKLRDIDDGDVQADCV